MDDEGEIIWPEWASELYERIVGAFEGLMLAGPEGYYSPPDRNPIGVHVITVAPALAELREPGPDDGETIYDASFSVDLLAVQAALDDVEDVSLIIRDGDMQELSVGGKVGGHEVLVEIRLVPDEDAAPRTAIERDAEGRVVRMTEIEPGP